MAIGSATDHDELDLAIETHGETISRLITRGRADPDAQARLDEELGQAIALRRAAVSPRRKG